MKKIIGLLLLLVILWPSVAFADSAMQIRSIDVKVDVDSSNTYQVKETIQINWLQERRGLIRDIARNFYGYNHDINNVRVTDETGRSHPFTTTSHGSWLEVRIGDPDTYLFGPVTYVIEYSFVMGADRNSEFDQVYWNLIGNDWTSPIEDVTYQVTMPFDFDDSTLNVTRGLYDSVEKANWVVSGRTVSGAVGRLAPGESLTFRLDMAEGYFVDAPKPYNPLHFYGMFGVVGAAILAALGIKRKNAANNVIIPVVNFEPPFGMNPPEMGYISSEEILKDEDMATLIIYWASKGYLRIIEQESSSILGSKSDMTFERLVDSSALDSDYEQRLFKKMFRHGNGQTVTMNQLKHKFYSDIATASNSLRKQFRGDREILVNSYQYLPGMLILAVLIAATLFIGYQLAWLMGINTILSYIITAVVLLLLLFVAAQIQSRREGHKVELGCLTMALTPMIFMAVYLFFSRSFSFGQLFSSFSFPRLSDPWLWFVVASFLLTGFLFYTLAGIKKYTNYAREHLGQIRGFKDFLEKAKTEELNLMFENNPNYYYDMLPYVYVFGLTDIWEDHLKNLTIPAPDWYQGDRPFYPRRFHTDFNSNFRTANSPPPSQSSSGGSRSSSGGGFGGGGFSGGGGGGGGGRSW